MNLFAAAPGWAQEAGQGSAPENAGDFGAEVRPFVMAHCVKCHGPDEQKGRLRLDTLSGDFSDLQVAEKWAEVVHSVNRHEMPPEEEPQPDPEAAGRFTEFLSAGLARAEVERRSARVVLRRLNRAEYNLTIRDLMGVDADFAGTFPEDPPAGGFDNIGQALTISPMQVELYYEAAHRILDRVLVEGPQPDQIQWRFEPEENTKGADRHRVQRDGNSILLNDGENQTDGGFTVVHHQAWNTGVGFRGFKVPVEGEYIIRFRAAGRVPDRQAVINSVETMLKARRDRQSAEKPAQRKHFQEQMDRDLDHFKQHRSYDYGPPRVKITLESGGSPRVTAEQDIPDPESAPGIHEVRAWFTTANAGLNFDYAYSVPRSLENFWMQDKESFARPLLLIDWIELEGPVHSQWPPAGHKMVMAGDPGEDSGADWESRARGVLSQFMARAWRRPPEPDEVEAKVGLFQKWGGDGRTFTESMKVPLAAVLASPHFLYLVESAGNDPPDGPARALSGWELASRLSYFLWSSLPDAELLRLAESGELTQPSVLRAQAQRMLADPKSAAFVRHFAGQWLGLRKVGANPPSEELYPEYDRHLEISIVRETESFFAEILNRNLDVRNFLKSDFVTINERLARFYDIPGVKGDAIRAVPAPASSHRGGLVTQASMHSITSNGTRTSPVVRGTWVLRTLLGSDPGLPVANVGEIPSEVPGIDKATVRQRLEIHRSAPSCARCHNKIDPLGLALENYNAAGEWRDREGHGYQGRIGDDDPLIDASARMPDGTNFTGPQGLQDQLLRQEELFLKALATRLFTYALGRETGFSDGPAIRSAVEASRRENYRLDRMILSIVQSEPFTTK